MRHTKLNIESLKNNSFPRIPSSFSELGGDRFQNVENMRLTRRDSVWLAGMALVPIIPFLRVVKFIAASLFRSSSSVGAITFSRRQVLRLAIFVATILALSMLPFQNAIASKLGSIEVVNLHNRIVFKLAGQERWVIDSRRFAGNPRIFVREMNTGTTGQSLLDNKKNGIISLTSDFEMKNDTQLRIELTGARYPGTNIPADFTCELRKSGIGWIMNLRLAIWGFSCEVPFESWLGGVVDASSAVTLDNSVCKLDDGSELILSGQGEAQFFPNWVIRVTGQRIVDLVGSVNKLVSDSLVVSLLDVNEPSVFNQPMFRRSLMRVERGGHSWSFNRVLKVENEVRVLSNDNSFDTIIIESGESRTGLSWQLALVALSNEKSEIFFQPHSAFMGTDRKPFSLPIRKARYAVALDGSGSEAVFVGRFSSDPVWLHTRGCNLQLGDSKSAAPLEIITTNDRIEHLICMPALLGIALPLVGAVVEPVKLAEESTVAFVTNAKAKATAEVTQQAIGDVTLMPQAPLISLKAEKFECSVLRPEDHLCLRFQFINFRVQTSGRETKLVREKLNEPAYIVVHFPPQNIAEEAFYEPAPTFRQPTTHALGSDRNEPSATANNPETLKPPGEVRTRISGSSRLVFKVPREVNEIPYTIANLLNWSNYELSVAPVALPPPPPEPISFEPLPFPGLLPIPKVGPLPTPTSSISSDHYGLDQVGIAPLPGFTPSLVIPAIKNPELHETAIEAPYRLIISPNRYATWVHSSTAITRNNRTELWHTRLAIRLEDGTTSENDHWLRTLRAIWTPGYADYDPDNREDWPKHYNTITPQNHPDIKWNYPFRMSLDHLDRYELVRLTSDYGIIRADGVRFVPKPVYAEQLMLTSLGAWMNIKGDWEPPQMSQQAGLTIEEWRHRTTLGRDHFVRVVYKGFLFPFGHRASLIKVTERKFEFVPGNRHNLAAYLRQRMFIVIREPIKRYPAVGQINEARHIPFQSIRITNLRTPNLDDPNISQIGRHGQEAFWPMVAGSDFLFHIVAEDKAGQRSEFQIPLAFIASTVAFDESNMESIATIYNDPNNWQGRKVSKLDGQTIAFAQPRDKNDRNTDLETEEVEFGGTTGTNVQFADLVRHDQPWFYPTVRKARVRIPALAKLGALDTAMDIKYNQKFIEQGMGAVQNKAEVFAETLGQVVLNFGAKKVLDKVGALFTPNMQIGGISRLLGPVGGVINEDVLRGKFRPEDFFGELSELAEAKILGGIPLKSIINWDNIETLAMNEFQKAIPRFVTEMIQEAQQPIGVVARFTWEPEVKPFWVFETETNTSLVAKAVIKKFFELRDQSDDYEVKADLRNFRMNLFDFFIIHFNTLNFTARKGQRSRIDVDIEKIEFGRTLSFVNRISDYLPILPENLNTDVTSDKILATYSKRIPSIHMGSFNLQNLDISAGVTIPLSGAPARARFAIASEDHPFTLTVAMFSGGGFLAIDVGMDGVHELAGSLEFGGSFALDIRVASGGIHCRCGIYYAFQRLENGRDEDQLGGYFRMNGSLRLLGIVTASMSLNMSLGYVQGGKVEGSAGVSMGVDMGLWCVCVEFTVRRRFGGSPTPFFDDIMDEQDWSDYVEAFA